MSFGSKICSKTNYISSFNIPAAIKKNGRERRKNWRPHFHGPFITSFSEGDPCSSQELRVVLYGFSIEKYHLKDLSVPEQLVLNTLLHLFWFTSMHIAKGWFEVKKTHFLSTNPVNDCMDNIVPKRTISTRHNYQIGTINYAIKIEI